MDKESVISYYYRIAMTLKERIRSGEYDRDEIIPSEKKLSKEFEVSEITIRKALDLLSNEGWVVRKRGIGTRVVGLEESRLPINVTGNFRDWFDTASGRYPRHLDVEVLDISISNCPNRIRKILSIPPEAKVWRMKRVRKLEGEPISYYINYAPQDLFDDVDKDAFYERTLFELLQEKCDFCIDKIDQRVEATSADLDVGAVLEMDFGDPIFYCENTYYVGDRALELSRIFYRGDRYVYHAVIDL